MTHTPDTDALVDEALACIRNVEYLRPDRAKLRDVVLAFLARGDEYRARLRRAVTASYLNDARLLRVARCKHCQGEGAIHARWTVTDTPRPCDTCSAQGYRLLV